MHIECLLIDFPEIEGCSSRQIWYAEQLRKSYVMSHFDRFEYISEQLEIENDNRLKENGDGYSNEYDNRTYGIVLSDAEKMVLNCTSAGGLIAFFKEIREKMEV